MIKKIIHCSDIHIRNIKRHEEYTEQLSKFIDDCKNLASSYNYEEVRILLAGDLFHQKIQTSNEQTKLLSWFLRELEKVFPVVLMAGNHDFMESNMDRLDSITPIINLMGLKNVRYLDMETKYKSNCVVDDNIVWCLYSIFDNYNRPDIDIERINHADKTFVGLYHGVISGSKIDSGFTLEHGVSKDVFNGCNVVMCGDIHLRQELDYNGIKIVMPGSLIQQDRAESVSKHGYLIWDVENLDYEEVDIPTEYGFYKFKINSVQDVEDGLEEFVNF